MQQISFSSADGFQGYNLYGYLGSKKQDIACSKSTYHRFLSNEHYNWKRVTKFLSFFVGKG